MSAHAIAPGLRAKATCERQPTSVGRRCSGMESASSARIRRPLRRPDRRRSSPTRCRRTGTEAPLWLRAVRPVSLRSRAMTTRWACAISLLLLATWTGSARADAVPPPPADCPPGRVPITSHRGPECALAPPKNCPPGYSGEVGGKCALQPCDSDENCAAWQRCKEVELCVEPHLVKTTCGALTPEAKSLIGAPCERVQPYTRWDPKSICKKVGDCPAPGECRMGKLCFAKGYRVPPGPPLTGQTESSRDASVASGAPDAGSMPSETDAAATPPTSDSGAEQHDVMGNDVPTEPAQAPGPGASVPITSEHPGGCGRGCTTGGSPRAAGVLGLLVLLVAVRSARRR